MDDDNSRLMPGRKDVKSVKKPGKKKSLPSKTASINEHWRVYSTLMMNPCGCTKFFQLRPQHVIKVGSAGTHSECV